MSAYRCVLTVEGAYNNGMIFDLHCHSNVSDGKLSPEAVISRVKEAGVELFSLTDHDSIAAYQQIDLSEMPFTMVSGIELSCQWAGVSVHIVGLDFDLQHPEMLKAIAHQREVRAQRAQIIDERLAKKGMLNTLQGALTFCPDIGQVGRPHFAQYMLDQGYVSSMKQAFDRWLGNGKLGDVKSGWPELQQCVQWINDAGGVAVLAHPLRYKLTFSKLKRLIEAFSDSGGAAVEVVGQQSPQDKKKQLTDFVIAQGLAGSGGSDFHDPSWAWAQIGCVEPLPKSIQPVWERFERTDVVRGQCRRGIVELAVDINK